jgi:hypothetical protein
LRLATQLAIQYNKSPMAMPKSRAKAKNMISMMMLTISTASFGI